jgi:hypothetical protein
MTDMLLYIMDPIYKEHPELEPPQLKTDPQRRGKGSP